MFFKYETNKVCNDFLASFYWVTKLLLPQKIGDAPYETKQHAEVIELSPPTWGSFRTKNRLHRNMQSRGG